MVRKNGLRMDVELKTSVAEFLIEKGYKYLCLYTSFDEMNKLKVRLKPTKSKPEHFNTGEYSFFEISLKDYLIHYPNRKEWVILDLPNSEIEDFKKREFK
ncbi:hypothetical protein EIM50_18445 [Pseudoxanthomonas sp. SGD-10]|nr:hypothetical protein EIM50_18445 [Pseudoxanthomonas sp. SGD-10]